MSTDDTEREAIRLAAMREVVEAMGRVTSGTRPGFNNSYAQPLLIVGSAWVRPSVWSRAEPEDLGGSGGDTLLQHLGLID